MEIAGVVPLAPKGLGGQIGGVSLDHDPVHREPVDDLQGLSGVLVGDDSRKGEHPPKLDQYLGILQAAGIAVVHPGDLGMLPHDGEAVLVGLPVVDDNGQAEGLCQLQLAVEHVLLESPGRVVLPVVIQADFAHGLYLPAATLFLNPL